MDQPQMAQVRIRWATESDAAKIVYFIRELARFEREPLEHVKITEAVVRRDGFGAGRRFEVLIAELDAQAVGLALFFPNYSTWEGKPGLYLEDIFVEESARKAGVGKALIAALAAVAKSRGCARIESRGARLEPCAGLLPAARLSPRRCVANLSPGRRGTRKSRDRRPAHSMNDRRCEPKLSANRRASRAPAPFGTSTFHPDSQLTDSPRLLLELNGRTSNRDDKAVMKVDIAGVAREPDPAWVQHDVEIDSAVEVANGVGSLPRHETDRVIIE